MNNLSLKIKAVEPGAFDPAKVYQAVAWDGSITDRQGDTFEASTFDLSVLTRHPLPLLFGHDSTKIAGAIDSAEVVEAKLMISFRLSNTDLGREMAELISSQALNTVSVGFIARRSADGAVARELVEVSLTPTPANPGAVITTRDVVAETTITSGDTKMGPSIVRSKSEQNSYSLNRFMLGLSDPLMAKNAGFEFEVSRELARLSGKSSDAAMIPWAALATKSQETLTTGTPNPGASLATPVAANELFTITAAAVFKSSIAARAGIQFHQAPTTSEMLIPRMVSGLKADFVARDTNLGESTAMFDTVSATPKTVGGLARVMRSALVDTNPAMEALVVAELRKAISDAIDSAVLGGRANANAPEGLLDLIAAGAPIASHADLMKAIRTAQVTDDTAQLAILTGIGFQTWASQQAVSPTLALSPAFIDGVLVSAPGVSIVASAKLDLDATGVMTSTIPVLLGDTRFCHVVNFGAGIEVGVNPYGQTDWARGSILARTIADIDFVCTDVSRWSRGDVTVA